MLRWPIRIFFFILSFQGSFALSAGKASDCPEVDLNEATDSPLKKMPMYDQDGSNICHAYVTAEMADYYRVKNKIHPDYGPSSPLHLAFLSKGRDLGDLHATGASIEDDYKALIASKGICSEAEVQKAVQDFTGNSSIGEGQLLHYLDYRDQYQNPDMLESKMISCSQLQSLNSTFQSLDPVRQAPVHILSSLFENCTKHAFAGPSMKARSLPQSTAAENMQLIQKSLIAGYPPVMGICKNVFEEKSYEGISGKNYRKDCEFHGVLVTAETKMKGQCVQLVRNSFGSFWQPKGAEACACIDKQGQYKKICTPSEQPREFVGCWFTKKALGKNISSTNMLN